MAGGEDSMSALEDKEEELDNQGNRLVRRYHWEPEDLGMLWKDHINQ